MWRLLKVTIALALLAGIGAAGVAYWWVHNPLPLPATPFYFTRRNIRSQRIFQIGNLL